MNKADLAIRLKELNCDPVAFHAQMMNGHITCVMCEDGQLTAYEMLIYLEREVRDHTDVFAEIIGESDTGGGGKILYEHQLVKYQQAMDSKDMFTCPECFGTGLARVDDKGMRQKSANELMKRLVPTLSSVEVESTETRIMFAMVDQLERRDQGLVSALRLIDEIRQGKADYTKIAQLAQIEDPQSLRDFIEGE